MALSATSTEEISNVTGAVVFVAYVLAALLLTIFLIYSLVTTYINLDTVYKRLVYKKLQLLTFMSCISFGVLSYNMLSYLIVSYQAWAKARDIPLPESSHDLIKTLSYLNPESQLHLWQWLKTSTLFKDFAQTICAGNGAFFWTGQALVVTMAWSIFMSVEGRRLGIPHLWAYAFISQILPVSFAMNLFFIAMLVCCPINRDSGWLVDLKGSTHLAGDSELFTHLENESAPTETESKESPRASSRGQVKIPCRTKNGGVADLTLEDVVYLPQFYPSVVSVPQLENAGYSWKRTLKGITFSKKEDTDIITASMHPSGIYLIDTTPPPPPTQNQVPPISSLPFREILLLSSTILFTLALHSAPLFSQPHSHHLFIPLILTLRILILLPFLLSRYYTTAPSTSTSASASPSSPAPQSSYLLLLGSYLFEATRLASLVRGEDAWSSTSMGWGAVFRGINADPAVSALGWDLVLVWGSVVVWAVEGQEGLGRGRGWWDAGVTGGLWGMLWVLQVVLDGIGVGGR